MNVLMIDKNSVRWLVNKAAAEQLYIVVPDELRKEEVLAIAKEMKLYIPKPITLREFMQSKDKNKFEKELLLYNVDIMLSYLFKTVFKGVKVKTCSASSELLRSVLK